MDPKLAEALRQMSLSNNSRGNNPSTSNQAQACQGGAAALPENSAMGGAAGVVKDEVFSQIFPMLQGYMNQESALACRRVCKDWKKGVDEALSGNSKNSESYSKKN